MPLAGRHGRPDPRRAPAGRLFLAAGALLAGYLVAAALAMLLGRVPPGLRLGGVGLAWRSEAGIRAALREAARQPLALRLDPELAEPAAVPAAALGLRLDEEAALATASAWANSRAGRLRVLSLGWPRVERPLPWLVDEAAARAGLAALKARLDRRPQAGRIHVEGGRATLTDYREGRSLDIEASVAGLVAAGQGNTAGWSPAFVPLAPAEDAPGARHRAEQRLAGDLALEAYDPIEDRTFRWSLGPEHWAAAVTGLDWEDGRWRWRLDPARVEDLAGSLGAGLSAGRYLAAADLAAALAARLDGDAAAFARVWHAPRQVTVAEGDTLASIGRREGLPFPWILAANPGVGDSLRPGQVLALPSPDGLLPLPPLRDRRILVFLADQRLEAWEDGERRWSWPVSTGIPSSPTAPGVFQVQDRQEEAFASAWELWMPRFIAIYRPDPRRDVFNGFHGLPWKEGGERLWAGLIGRPASYGCIVLADEHAQLLYGWAAEGTVVEVRE